MAPSKTCSSCTISQILGVKLSFKCVMLLLFKVCPRSHPCLSLADAALLTQKCVVQLYTSGSSRSTRMFEIGDVQDDLAEEHLVKMGLSNNLAKKLVGYLGGRCVYLYKACFIYSRYRAMKKYADDDDEMCTQIIKDMWALKINGQRTILALCKPYSSIIIENIAKNKEIVLADLIEERKGSKREGFKCAIQRFVNGNYSRRQAAMAWKAALEITIW